MMQIIRSINSVMPVTTRPKRSTEKNSLIKFSEKYLNFFTFETYLALLSRVPLEAIANDLIVRFCDAGSMIVTSLASDKFLRANSSRINWIFRLIHVTFHATACVGSQQVETVRELRTIMTFFYCRAFIKVVHVKIVGEWLGVQVSSPKVVILFVKILFDGFPEFALVGVLQELNVKFANDSVVFGGIEAHDLDTVVNISQVRLHEHSIDTFIRCISKIFIFD